jgi:hypothetical protein
MSLFGKFLFLALTLTEVASFSIQFDAHHATATAFHFVWNASFFVFVASCFGSHIMYALHSASFSETDRVLSRAAFNLGEDCRQISERVKKVDGRISEIYGEFRERDREIQKLRKFTKIDEAEAAEKLRKDLMDSSNG